jgi:hypothetical protein
LIYPGQKLVIPKWIILKLNFTWVHLLFMILQTW